MYHRIIYVGIYFPKYWHIDWVAIYWSSHNNVLKSPRFQIRYFGWLINWIIVFQVFFFQASVIVQGESYWIDKSESGFSVSKNWYESINLDGNEMRCDVDLPETEYCQLFRFEYFSYEVHKVIFHLTVWISLSTEFFPDYPLIIYDLMLRTESIVQKIDAICILITKLNKCYVLDWMNGCTYSMFWTSGYAFLNEWNIFFYFLFLHSLMR